MQTLVLAGTGPLVVWKVREREFLTYCASGSGPVRKLEMEVELESLFRRSDGSTQL